MKNIETHYLIDYENVHSDGLSGCEELKETDHIVIFFTDNAKKIDMDEIYDHGDASLKMEKIAAGKQSVDIHIGSWLGYLSGIHQDDHRVVIVSKDTDFDHLMEYWHEKTGIHVSRRHQIKENSSDNDASSGKSSKNGQDKSKGQAKAKEQPKTKGQTKTKEQPKLKDQPNTKAQSKTKDQPASGSKSGQSKSGSDQSQSMKNNDPSQAKGSSKSSRNDPPNASSDQTADAPERPVLTNAVKSNLVRDIKTAVVDAGYADSVVKKVTQFAVESYGIEHMLTEVHNALRECYEDYLDVYNAVKPALSKYADVSQQKVTPGNKGDNTQKNQPKQKGDNAQKNQPKQNSSSKQKGNSAQKEENQKSVNNTSKGKNVLPEEKTALNAEIQKTLSSAGYKSEIISYVASTAVKNLGVEKGKQLTYRAIISKFGQATGLEIYNSIKKII